VSAEEHTGKVEVATAGGAHQRLVDFAGRGRRRSPAVRKRTRKVLFAEEAWGECAVYAIGEGA
jgi:hypothetical protein